MKAKDSSNNKGQSRSKSRLKMGKYHYCHKSGHLMQDCPKLKEKEKKVASFAQENSDNSKNIISMTHCNVRINDVPKP